MLCWGNMSLKKGGDEPDAKNAKVDPVPRHLPLQTITLNFVQRTWEEISPTELYYLPTCQNPRYMFDPSMESQFRKFSGLWESMTLNEVGFKMSNLIMLQDDLRVQNNTPTDATAFTQVVYLIHFTPFTQKQYFKLTNIVDADSLRGDTLHYELEPKSLNSQLVVFKDGFTSFEHLGILPGKSNLTGGLAPTQAPLLDNNYNILNNYIPPNAVDPFNTVAGNLQMQDSSTYFVMPKTTTTFARNQDHIHFMKYGDTYGAEITTNLKGVPLLNTARNNFLEYVNFQYNRESDLALYDTEWCYPGRHRPFFSRADYLVGTLNTLTNARNFKPLNHHFFCMPPIKKPNGATLGQRCSFMLEQHCSVTFKMSQTFHEFENDFDQRNQLEQDDGVILRRNFYGKVSPSTGGTESPFCGRTKRLKCEPPGGTLKRKLNAEVCPNDDWAGLSYAMAYIASFWISEGLIGYTKVPPTDPNIVGPFEMAYITTTDIQADPIVLNAWYDNINKQEAGICFKVNPLKVVTDLGQTWARWGEFTAGPGLTRFLELLWREELEEYVYVTLYFERIWDYWAQSFPGMTCVVNPPDSERKVPQRTNYVNSDRNSFVFFT